MSYSVKGTTINLTRGDTFSANIQIFQPDGTIYRLDENDVVRFAMKKKITDVEPIILKDLEIHRNVNEGAEDTILLILEPSDTKDLDFGSYIYDIQLTKSNGIVDTFITKSTINITEEVY